MKPWYKSRKLWVAVASLAMLVLDATLLHVFDQTTKTTLAAIASSYVLGQGIADRPTTP